MPARSSSRHGRWQQAWGSGHGGDARNRSKSQSRSKQSQWKGDPFYWKCGRCSNIQSGSECKDCKAKWWEVSWERWAKPESTTKWTPQYSGATGVPTLGTNPHQSMAAVLHQLANPAPGAPPPDPEILELAHNLNKQLLARCPIEEKQKKLQSVPSKLDHHGRLLTKAQDRLQKLQQETRDLQEECKAQTLIIAELETERKQLVGVVKTHLEQSDNRKNNSADKGEDTSSDPEGISSGGEADSETSET